MNTRCLIGAIALMVVIALVGGRAGATASAEERALFTPVTFQLRVPSDSTMKGALPGAGAVAAASIPDKRTKVTDTSLEPYKHSVFVLELVDGDLASCSGLLLGANVVLTAAHCLVNSGSVATAITVSVGGKGLDAPEGDRAAATHFDVPQEWLRTGAASEADEITTTVFDFGLIYLAGRPFASLAPFPVLGAEPTDFFASLRSLLTVGYPGDKAIGSMWEDTITAPLTTSLGARFSVQTIGKPGQSGSPFFAMKGADRIVVGVLTAGGDTSIAGRKVTAQMIGVLNDWCSHNDCVLRSEISTLYEPPSRLTNVRICRESPYCKSHEDLVKGKPIYLSFSIGELASQLDVWVYLGGVYQFAGRLRLTPPDTGPFGGPSPMVSAAQVGTYQVFVFQGDTYIGAINATVPSFSGKYHTFAPVMASDTGAGK